MPRSAKEINRSCTATVSSHLIQIAETFLFIFSSLSSLPCVRACRTALQRTFRFFHMGNILCRAMAHCVCRANRAQSDREKIDMMILWTITCWLGCCHFCAIFYNFIISVVVVFLFFFLLLPLNRGAKKQLSVNSARIAKDPERVRFDDFTRQSRPEHDRHRPSLL